MTFGPRRPLLPGARSIRPRGWGDAEWSRSHPPKPHHDPLERSSGEPRAVEAAGLGRSRQEPPPRVNRRGTSSATRCACRPRESCVAVPGRGLDRCPWWGFILLLSRYRQEGVEVAPHLPAEYPSAPLDSRSARAESRGSGTSRQRDAEGVGEAALVLGLVTPSFLVSPAFFAPAQRGRGGHTPKGAVVSHSRS